MPADGALGYPGAEPIPFRALPREISGRSLPQRSDDGHRPPAALIRILRTRE
jgi:hypothetical protein